MEFFDVLEKEDVEKEDIEFKEKSKDYILSMPHGGTLIPKRFLKNLKIERGILIGSDLYTDKLFDTEKGIQIISNLSVYLVNYSRFRMGSKDKKLPKHLQHDPFQGEFLEGGNALKVNYTNGEKEELLKYYDRYHEYLEKAIKIMKEEKGYALIFDCHSMNSIALENTPDKGEERPDFNIGTLDGNSADKKIIDIFVKNMKEECRGENLTVKENYPYKGGYITKKYAEKTNIIQIEIKRDLFMHEGLKTRKNEFQIKEEGLKKINKILTKVFSKTIKSLNIENYS